MKPSTRILSDNRRERGGRRVDLSEYLLYAAAALLSLLGSFGRHREAPKVRERLSDVLDGEYAEFLDAEKARTGCSS